MTLKDIRRKVAGWVLGEQSALFIPKDESHVLKGGCYEDLTDEHLAMATRYWFDVIRRVNADIAGERGIPASVFSTSQSAMSLIRYAREANAENLTIAQHGTIKDIDVGNWLIEVTKLPDDYEFGPLGVQEKIYSDDGRLTKLALGYSFDPLTPTDATS